MIIVRNNEMNQLNHYYDRDGSQIVVVYGQKNIGKTTLIREFTVDKPCAYYGARSCSEREQQYEWGKELAVQGIRTSKYPSYGELLAAVTDNDRAFEGKLVLVIDEFQNMLKSDSSFMKELIAHVHKQWKRRQILVLLVSSSVGFVENSMIKRIGEAAYELSGLLKVKELKFRDCMEYFSRYDKNQCIEVYSLLGGVPGLWKCFDDTLSVKTNILQNILSSRSALYYEAERMVSEELRETAVYNTILAAIAEGKHKLNDLYLHTEFSRAKISVYLKNLMELELVEKVFSYDTDGNENVQKGIYRISSRFLHFYYKFVYPNRSTLESESEAYFYKTFIENDLKSFIGEYFRSVCMEHMDEQNMHNRLPVHYDRAGEWVGKEGTIDIIAQDENANTVIALCNYDRAMTTYADYEKLLFCASRARISAQYIYLFSQGRFDEKLELEAKIRKNLKLITTSDL